MATHALSLDLIWRVAMFSDTDVRLVFLLTSRAVYSHLCSLLYRYIVVGIQAKKLVRSLAKNHVLPPLVKSLIFEDPAARVDPGQWASILPAMPNLIWLIISPCIPLSREVIPHIAFRLEVFGSISSVGGAWVEFVASQHTLLELSIDSDFLGEVPTLPLLRSMKGRPADLARFAQHHSLLDLWFYTGPPYSRRGLEPADLQLFLGAQTRLCTLRMWPSQFLLLLGAAPTVVATLQHLVLDEDPSWAAFTVDGSSTLGEHSPLARVATQLGTLRCMENLLLVCSRHPDRPRRFLQRSDGAFFSRAMSARCTAPRLREFHFYGMDGFATWTNWVACLDSRCGQNAPYGWDAKIAEMQQGNETHLEHDSPTQLGLHLRLGNGAQGHCANPWRSTSNFVAITRSGAQLIAALLFPVRQGGAAFGFIISLLRSCLHTVRLARPPRNIDDVLAQKETAFAFGAYTSREGSFTGRTSPPPPFLAIGTRWQATMAQLPDAVLQWAQKTPAEIEDANGTPRNAGVDDLASLLQQMDQVASWAGTRLIQTMEAMESELEFDRLARDHRDTERTREHVVSVARDAMREPDRRDFLEEQRAEERRYSAPWQVRARRTRETAVRRDLFDDSWADWSISTRPGARPPAYVDFDRFTPLEIEEID
ncbi:hypothetical protein B0H19DRAFT_1253680 [Mycena capillaripes]|nr:hypothetical protein B0H19DRAFT_1253680 [Mycena capillaripes]